nr:57_t:CDS:2 [Entrophospora candida]CAG8645955.1 13982_t:CDS:2 [Entrophospora candida]
MAPNESDDVFENFTYGMIKIHDTLRAGMVQILENAPKVPTSDVENFIGYIETFNSLFMSHHHHEEHIVFPSVSKKIPISDFVEEHKQLNKFLHSLSNYTSEVKNKKATYEPSKIVDLMTKISKLILPHLKNEEVTFSVEALRKNFTEQELEKIQKQIKDAVRKDGGLTTILPFILLHLPQEDRDIMLYSKMPWFVKSLLLPYVIVRWNQGYWKYAKYQHL